jgi:hypothetical protein
MFHGSRARFVVVRHVIDSSAYGIAPHLPSIVGLQQFGRRIHIPHPRIEPKIVAVWIKDHRHAVVNGCGHNIWSRGQNRAGLQRFAVRVFPAIPYSREQLAFIDFKTVRLLCFPCLLPLLKPICWDEAPASFQRVTKRGLHACRLRSCVDHLGSDRRVFRPRWNESPAD